MLNHSIFAGTILGIRIIMDRVHIKQCDQSCLRYINTPMPWSSHISIRYNCCFEFSELHMVIRYAWTPIDAVTSQPGNSTPQSNWWAVLLRQPSNFVEVNRKQGTWFELRTTCVVGNLQPTVTTQEQLKSMITCAVGSKCRFFMVIQKVSFLPFLKHVDHRIFLDIRPGCAAMVDFGLILIY